MGGTCCAEHRREKSEKIVKETNSTHKVRITFQCSNLYENNNGSLND